MELRVESADGYDMLPGSYIGVRVGDVLKQGRYEPQRCYHFPMVDRRRNAKIDLYQLVGSCNVSIDPETKSMHEVNMDNILDGSRIALKVNVQSKGGEAVKSTREARTKAMKTQAKDYLCKHGIEERLSVAVKALLKEQPADPTEFLCRMLKNDGADTIRSPTAAEETPRQAAPALKVEQQKTAAPREPAREKPPAPGPPPASNAGSAAPLAWHLKPSVGTWLGAPPREDQAPAQSAAPLAWHLKPSVGTWFCAPPCRSAPREEQAPAQDLSSLRQQACDVLFKASADGELNKVLEEIKDEVLPEAAGKQDDDGSGNSLPAMMLPMMSFQGPDFATLGMTPGMQFI